MDYVAIASIMAQVLSNPLVTAIIGLIGMAIVTWLPLAFYLVRAFGRTEAQIADLTKVVEKVAVDPNVVRWSEVTDVAVTRRTHNRGKRE